MATPFGSAPSSSCPTSNGTISNANSGSRLARRGDKQFFHRPSKWPMSALGQKRRFDGRPFTSALTPIIGRTRCKLSLRSGGPGSSSGPSQGSASVARCCTGAPGSNSPTRRSSTTRTRRPRGWAFRSSAPQKPLPLPARHPCSAFPDRTAASCPSANAAPAFAYRQECVWPS